MIHRTLPCLRRAWENGMASISTILIAVVFGGIVTACAPSTLANDPSGSAPHATPTKSVPEGFTKYQDQTPFFSIAYPSDWKTGGEVIGQTFTGPAGQSLWVEISQAAGTNPAAANTQTCQNVATTQGGSASSPTVATITLDGQHWQQLDCGATGTVHAIVESVVFDNQLYTLSYSSPTATFEQDRTRYFSVMEQHFAFL